MYNLALSTSAHEITCREKEEALRKALEETLPQQLAAMTGLEEQLATLQRESEEKLKAAEEARLALEAKLRAAADQAIKLAGPTANASTGEANASSGEANASSEATGEAHASSGEDITGSSEANVKAHSGDLGYISCR